jgi:DNA-binding IclR family transcriptional regulator
VREDAPEGPTAKVFAVLGAVAERRRSIAIAEVAEALGMPLPTAHRIVAGLVGSGWLERSPGSKRLVVGPRLLELSFKVSAASFGDGVRDALLQALADALGEQVELGAVRGAQVVYFATVRSVRPASLQFEPGRRAPLHCTSTGKLFLAEMAPGQRARMVRSLALARHAARTITDPEALLRQLEEVRAAGFATTVEEFAEGVAGCAVPIRDRQGAMVAALGVTVPLARLGPEGPTRHLDALRSTAARLGETFAERRAAEGAAMIRPTAHLQETTR